MYVVESKIGPRLSFSSQTLVQGWVKNWSKMFSLFCLNFRVLEVLLKSQIVCKGAKIIFWQVVGVFERDSKKCGFFVFVVFMLEKEKEKR